MKEKKKVRGVFPDISTITSDFIEVKQRYWQMSMQPLEFDVIVVGSGAGAKIARPAAQLGLRVAYIEESAWGGTCLNK